MQMTDMADLFAASAVQLSDGSFQVYHYLCCYENQTPAGEQETLVVLMNAFGQSYALSTRADVGAVLTSPHCAR